MNHLNKIIINELTEQKKSLQDISDSLTTTNLIGTFSLSLASDIKKKADIEQLEQLKAQILQAKEQESVADIIASVENLKLAQEQQEHKLAEILESVGLKVSDEQLQELVTMLVAEFRTALDSKASSEQLSAFEQILEQKANATDIARLDTALQSKMHIGGTYENRSRGRALGLISTGYPCYLEILNGSNNRQTRCLVIGCGTSGKADVVIQGGAENWLDGQTLTFSNWTKIDMRNPLKLGGIDNLEAKINELESRINNLEAIEVQVQDTPALESHNE